MTVLAVEGPDRVAFLQGQLTQEVRDLAPGTSRLAAGLTAQGKVLYFGRVLAEPDALLLLVEPDAGASALSHLSRFAAFQKVAVRDASSEKAVASLYGPRGPEVAADAGVRLPAWGELSAEIVAPAAARRDLEALLAREGSVAIPEPDAEALRIEAGRARFGREADPSRLPQEAGLEDAIAPDKGCYVGQEIVARLRTYGRVNRRLVGFRFQGDPLPPGTVFPDPEKPSVERGRVTSAAVSARFGPIGLGLAFREVPEGATLAAAGGSATVCALPFA